MKIHMLHLSDIHFKQGKNAIVNRVEQIKCAIQAADPDFSTCIIIITGDIAFSGKSTEYDIAHLFLNSLKDKIQTTGVSIIGEVFVPGNHDCDFSDDNIIRDTLLEKVLKDQNFLKDYNSSVMEQCLMVQRNFFDFMSKRSIDIDKQQQCSFVKKYTIENKCIGFYCCNSAWMSQRNEKQGQLIVPSWFLQEDLSDCDLVVSLFHHPYNWLEPDNSRSFRKRTEEISDIVITGHEHETGQFNKQTITGISNTYFEGAVLQNGEDDTSGFNLIVLDLDENLFKFVSYSWRRNIYSKQDYDWQPIKKNKHINRGFENNKIYIEKLNDIGIGFTHPQKSTITREDIFIYPDIVDITHTKEFSRDTSSSNIRDDAFLEYILNYKKILVVGGDKSGKTTLAKSLYVDLQKRGLVPVMLSGEALGSSRYNDKLLPKEVKKSFIAQYEEEMWERYEQLDKEYRVLIIDDIQLAKLNNRSINAIASLSGKLFDVVVFITKEIFAFEEIIQSNSSSEVNEVLSFRHCQIKEFGHRLRGKLIEKWLNLGQEYIGNMHDIVRKVSESEKLIDNLIGRNLLPSYPIFILSILQTCEAGTPHNMGLGSYGHHYEALITMALESAIKKLSSRVPTDILYTYLSMIAYYMFSTKTKSLDENQIEDITQEYKQNYKLRFNAEEVMKILEESRVFKNENGRVVFKYKYIYYYFVAKYISDNLNNSSYRDILRNQINSILDKLYVEDYANIVIFLVYLTKDEQTISKILSNAKELYSEHNPCDLDKDVEFINNMSTYRLPIQIKDQNIQNNKEIFRERLDEFETVQEIDKNPDEVDEDSDYTKETSEDIARINLSLKILQIMGQILRNFPGSLPGEMKLSVTRESYNLGLRLLNLLLNLMEENLDGMRHTIRELLKEKYQEKDNLSRKADEFIYIIAQLSAHSMIKQISHAVGSEFLIETYNEIEKTCFSIEIIDLSIKMDNSRNFPYKEIINLYNRMNKNNFTSNLLRYLVRDHLYLYPVDRRIKESVCGKLHIQTQDPKILAESNKKIKN